MNVCDFDIPTSFYTTVKLSSIYVMFVMSVKTYYKAKCHYSKCSGARGKVVTQKQDISKGRLLAMI